jgi:hypothetical protein
MSANLCPFCSVAPVIIKTQQLLDSGPTSDFAVKERYQYVCPNRDCPAKKMALSIPEARDNWNTRPEEDGAYEAGLGDGAREYRENSE